MQSAENREMHGNTELLNTTLPLFSRHKVEQKEGRGRAFVKINVHTKLPAPFVNCLAACSQTILKLENNFHSNSHLKNQNQNNYCPSTSLQGNLSSTAQ